jgi:hypothetical protein
MLIKSILDKDTEDSESEETVTERPDHLGGGEGNQEDVLGADKDTQLQNELEKLQKTYELMLAGDYESIPDASGAGSSLEKQEGNVHGYEQEEVTEVGEVSTKDSSVDIEKGNKTYNDKEKVFVTVFDVQDGIIADGEKQNAPIIIEVLNYNSAMPNRINSSLLNLKITANYNKKDYIFFVKRVKGRIGTVEENDISLYYLELDSDYSILGNGVDVFLYKGLKYKFVNL